MSKAEEKRKEVALCPDSHGLPLVDEGSPLHEEAFVCRLCQDRNAQGGHQENTLSSEEDILRVLTTLATTPPRDVVRLVLTEDFPTMAKEELRLDCVSSIEKKGDHQIKVTFYDRLEAVKLLMEWTAQKEKTQEKHQEEPALYKILGQGFARYPLGRQDTAEH